MFTKRFMAVALLSAFVSGSYAEGIMRTWHDKLGNSFMGEYTREQFGKFYFRGADKKVIMVEIDQLADKDVKFIYNSIPPKLDVKFKEKSWIRDMHPEAHTNKPLDFTKVEAVATISKKSDARFDGILQAEVYLVGEEIRNDENFKLLFKDSFPIKFDYDKKEKEYEYSTIIETIQYEEYDEERRGQDYCGYAIIIYGPNDEMLLFDSDLEFLKDETLIPAFRKLRIYSFFDEKCRNISVPRPNKFEFYDS